MNANGSSDLQNGKNGQSSTDKEDQPNGVDLKKLQAFFENYIPPKNRISLNPQFTNTIGGIAGNQQALL